MDIEIIPVGGYNEVGRNMTAVRCGREIVIFDMGLRLDQIMIHEDADYKARVPTWMLNRQKDVYTGEAKQLLGTDLRMAIDDDLNRMRKIRCYRGIRHETGQKVRGQRTKSTGRTGSTVGVRRKKN